MVTAKTVKGLADRLERAKGLLAAGAVFPVAGMTECAVVRNGDGTQMYLVNIAVGHESCTCPDFQQRQKAAGLPCKHILAADLYFRPIYSDQEPAPKTGSSDPVTPELVAKGVNMLLGRA